MDENTRVSKCPCRYKEWDTTRYHGSVSYYTCIYPEGNMARKDTLDGSVSCDLRGNTKLCKCTIYNTWSEKQVQNAFEKLDKLEAHRDAVLGVLRM